jgi:lipoprotein-releasing system permease protein
MNLTPWLPFEWVVAFRFLKEGRIQTAFIITGISIGVAVIVFMSALLTAMQANFVNRVLNGQAHIQLLVHKEVVRPLYSERGVVESPTLQMPLQRFKSIDQWQSVALEVGRIPEVKVVSPAISGSALLTRGEASRSVSVTGMIPELYFKIIPLSEKMVRGQALVTSESILIGTELATDMGVGIGDKLRISTGNGSVNILNLTGIFDLGNKGANSHNAFVAFRTAQSMFGLIGGASVLDLTLHDVYAAETVARHIERQTGLQADSWIKTNEQFFTAVKAQTTANTAIRLFVALSVGFGIASVLVVSVVQRSREIGILRAMGITRGQVLTVFLLQGGLLGFAGALLGASLGGAALVLWQKFQRNADGTVMFALNFDTQLLLQTVVLATLTGLLAAFAPALRAARLDPVVAIRG